MVRTRRMKVQPEIKIEHLSPNPRPKPIQMTQALRNRRLEIRTLEIRTLGTRKRKGALTRDPRRIQRVTTRVLTMPQVKRIKRENQHLLPREIPKSKTRRTHQTQRTANRRTTKTRRAVHRNPLPITKSNQLKQGNQDSPRVNHQGEVRRDLIARMRKGLPDKVHRKVTTPDRVKATYPKVRKQTLSTAVVQPIWFWIISKSRRTSLMPTCCPTSIGRKKTYGTS